MSILTTQSKIFKFHSKWSLHTFVESTKLSIISSFTLLFLNSNVVSNIFFKLIILDSNASTSGGTMFLSSINLLSVYLISCSTLLSFSPIFLIMLSIAVSAIFIILFLFLNNDLNI